MIHDDSSSLSDLKRFHYLSSYLKGDASKASDDIDIVETNYELAYNHLVSRYENKRKLITFRLRLHDNSDCYSTYRQFRPSLPKIFALFEIK